MIDEANLAKALHFISEIAYAAAAVDCEGCIGITTAQKKGMVNPSFAMRVAVYNTNPVLIDWLQSNFGGYTNLYQDKNSNHKPRWTWYIQHQAAADFLDLIQPYVKLKAKQVEIALEMQRLMSQSLPRKLGLSSEEVDKRWALKEAMMILNRKGPGDERL